MRADVESGGGGWVDVLGLERQPDKGYFFRETLLQASNG